MTTDLEPPPKDDHGAPPPDAVRVLLIDDDATLRRVLGKELGACGFTVETLPSASGALPAIADFAPHVLLLDLNLPGKGGMQLLREVRAADADLQVVVLTGHGAVPEAVAAMRLGAFDFRTKPTSLDVLEQTVRAAAQKHALLQENRRLRRLTTTAADPWVLLGQSRSMAELRHLVERLAASRAHVLITGESGSGKELVARNLHELGPRRERPFVVVNCGAIPAAIVESELFGHEKGAFTGAERKRVGLLDAAHGGTLFLDEVGELPLAVQPALLRAVQFGEVRPVGSARTHTVDVRVVAATNRDLLRAADDGSFRRDLYYRLAALQLDVPPLRARPDDVPLLAEAFLQRACTQQEGRRLSFSPQALSRLQSHAWPGNVRELENAMTRLCVLTTADTIGVEEVERHVLRRQDTAPAELPTVDVEELEKMAIAQAMRQYGGDKRAAAAALGVALKTLYNKLERYGMR